MKLKPLPKGKPKYWAIAGKLIPIYGNPCAGYFAGILVQKPIGMITVALETIKALGVGEILA